MSVLDEIVTWFADHDDGYFGRVPRTCAHTVIGPTSSTRTVIYTTKPLCILSRNHSDEALADTALVGGGLPTDDDVVWLHDLIRERDVCFLGDADPSDLLVFAWLRSHIDLKYAGISDSFLSRIDVSWKDHVTIPLSQSESEALPLLAKACPDYRQLLGPQLSSLLDSGRKLEVEAVTIYPDVDARTLVEAIASTGTET